MIHSVQQRRILSSVLCAIAVATGVLAVLGWPGVERSRQSMPTLQFIIWSFVMPIMAVVSVVVSGISFLQSRDKLQIVLLVLSVMSVISYATLVN